MDGTSSSADAYRPGPWMISDARGWRTDGIGDWSWSEPVIEITSGGTGRG
jgi:hypothetical protein